MMIAGMRSLSFSARFASGYLKHDVRQFGV
jgi:hypothetical protein